MGIYLIPCSLPFGELLCIESGTLPTNYLYNARKSASLMFPTRLVRLCSLSKAGVAWAGLGLAVNASGCGYHAYLSASIHFVYMLPV